MILAWIILKTELETIYYWRESEMKKWREWLRRQNGGGGDPLLNALLLKCRWTPVLCGPWETFQNPSQNCSLHHRSPPLSFRCLLAPRRHCCWALDHLCTSCLPLRFLAAPALSTCFCTSWSLLPWGFGESQWWENWVIHSPVGIESNQVLLGQQDCSQAEEMSCTHRMPEHTHTLPTHRRSASILVLEHEQATQIVWDWNLAWKRWDKD